MFVEARSGQPFCTLEISKTNRSSLSFLAHNPFIFLDKGHVKAAVFVNHVLQERELEEISSEYLLPGLDSLVVIACGSASVRQANESEENVSLQMSSETASEPITDVCHRPRKSGYNVQIFEPFERREELKWIGQAL